MNDIVLSSRYCRPACGLLMMLLSACAAYTPPPVYREMTRQEMFRALTTHTWFGETIDKGGRKETFEAIPYGRFRLFPNGNYDYEMMYDEGIATPRSGQWNFVKTGARTGVLRLSVDQNVFQVVLFAFATRNRLVTRGEGFQRAYLRREPRLNSSLAENGDLPEVPLPRSLDALVGTTWLLATDNRLLPHVPLELTFRSDGRVEQILTAEECRSERDREDHRCRR
ncbi:MAG TPA: hypothetical protein VE010_07395, partial [Thermoanaerobaculia bacterium]|nr:hypothetical protein [Thermoanaerobaculia bacterium]